MRRWGEGFVSGGERAALNGEMWVTAEGKLVMKLPGFSSTGDLLASDLGPDAVVVVLSQVIFEAGGPTLGCAR